MRSALGEAERAAILALSGECSPVEVRQEFVGIGERVDHACLIVDGLTARFQALASGHRSVVALHVPGDMADLHSVVAPEVTWALQAMTPSRILRIPHAALHALAARYPAIAVAFWRDCVVDANILAQWTVNIGRKVSESRVAHLLCEMGLRYRLSGRGDVDHFPFPITQANLADVVGLTPIHLNRVLRRLAGEGIAAKPGSEVIIDDVARLAAIGEFDPAYLQLSRAFLERDWAPICLTSDKRRN